MRPVRPRYVLDADGRSRTCNSLKKTERITRQRRRGGPQTFPLAHPTKKLTLGRLWASGYRQPRKVMQQRKKSRLAAAVDRLFGRFGRGG